MPQISSTVGHATLLTASLVACGMNSPSTTAIDSATKPTSTSNASATMISVAMPISVRILSRSSSGISSAAVAAEPPAIGRLPGRRGLLLLAPLEAGCRLARLLPPAQQLFRPPNRKKTMTLSTKLNTNEETNSSIAFSARSSRSTTPLTMLPNTLIGENPPAVAPLITMSPISTGLML